MRAGAHADKNSVFSCCRKMSCIKCRDARHCISLCIRANMGFIHNRYTFCIPMPFVQCFFMLSLLTGFIIVYYTFTRCRTVLFPRSGCVSTVLSDEFAMPEMDFSSDMACHPTLAARLIEMCQTFRLTRDIAKSPH